MIYSTTVANLLKETIRMVSSDADKKYDQEKVYTKFAHEDTMEDAYEDDAEVHGPPLLSEKAEGSEIAMLSIGEGTLTRYMARTFAGKLIYTRELIEDGKYKKAYDAARMLRRTAWLTVDYDMSLIPARGFNTAYTGGDGQPLWSASHVLASGGTFSNIMATPMSPSVLAVQTMATQVENFVGHDGLVAHHTLKKIMAPTAQRWIWEVLTGSSMTPQGGGSSEINTVKKMNLEVVINPFWLNTTTNWCGLTDCNDTEGIQARWRRKPTQNNWVDNDNQTLKHGVSYRLARGWTNPRCSVGSNA